MVYVMNDKGATVAKYDLGGWAGPVGPIGGSVGATPPRVEHGFDAGGQPLPDVGHFMKQDGRIG